MLKPPSVPLGPPKIPVVSAPKITKNKKHRVVLTAKELQEMPNYQGKYELPDMPKGSKSKLLCVKNPRTGTRTLFFRYFPMFGGFLGPNQPEVESGKCDLEWVDVVPGTEPFFCTPFTLFGLMYKPVFRLGSLSIRRTLEGAGIRTTGEQFASSRDEKGEANDWRLMWLQKNNHSGSDSERFGAEWSKYTKVGFPLDYYKKLRTAQQAIRDRAASKSNELGAQSAGAKPETEAWGSQFINHFPGSEALDNKSRMASCIREAAMKHPGLFEKGFPLSFCIPKDLSDLADHLQRLHQNAVANNNTEGGDDTPPLDLWLLKPPDLGGGHGIEVVSIEELQSLVDEAVEHQSLEASTTGKKPGHDAASKVPRLLSQEWVVQKYIAKPKLLDGFKHDLRLFFVVTSLDPVVVWTYPNAGIAKFCSSRYSRDPADLKNAYVHLGNQCLNITNPEFNQVDGVDGTGPRWSFGAWRTRMEAEGHDTAEIQRKIDNLVAKVVLACQPRILAHMRSKSVIESQCYELFGIDVVVDESGEPWLIEINNTPGYGNNKNIDNNLFFPLLADTWTCLGIDLPSSIPEEDNCSVIDRFEDQYDRRRHLRCVFPNPETISDLLPLVQTASAAAKQLYDHILSKSTP